MALRSELLTVELPDASGKTVSYYTYDGYLEEASRLKIRSERRKIEHMKVTAGAALGFIAFIVRNGSIRLQEDLLCLFFLSEESACRLLDFSLVLLEVFSDTNCSVSTAAAK
jgi:hypothetical protein